MKYRIEVTDEHDRLTSILLLDFRDDATAVKFANKIAKETKDQRIDIWDETRLVTTLPVPGSEKKTEATK